MLRQPQPGRVAQRVEKANNATWIIHKLIHAGAVHMLAGESNAGKTTWLFQILHEWEKGSTVLGHQAYPCPWVYIACDRGSIDTSLMMKRMNLLEWDAPLFSIEELFDMSVPPTIDMIFNHPLPDVQNAKLFVIDGWQMLVPDAAKGVSQNKTEFIWMAQLRAEMEKTGRTIIAITHPPKSKKDNGYTSIRSNILGSQSMGATAGTMIWVSRPDEEESADTRIVQLSGKHFKDFKIHYTIDSNGLFRNESVGQMSMPKLTAKAEGDDELSLAFLAEGPKEFETKEIIGFFQGKYGVSDITVKRWLGKACERGIINRIAHGRYMKVLVQ